MAYCGWPAIVPAAHTTEWAALPADVRDRAEHLAGMVLWTLTGQVFTVCDVTVRPCWQPDDQISTYGQPGRAGARWAGLLNTAGVTGPCGCSNDCRHVGVDRITLPGPVAAVTTVTVSGVVVPPTAYRVQDRRWLRRTDGQWWPQHQDLNLSDDAVGAFVIDYQRGIPVPADGQTAAGLLALEFARGLTGTECALPSGATSVSRQGINVELADIREWFTNGLTGVELVDLWIMAVNPYKSKRASHITSPDRPRVARFT